MLLFILNENIAYNKMAEHENGLLKRNNLLENQISFLKKMISNMQANINYSNLNLPGIENHLEKIHEKKFIFYAESDNNRKAILLCERLLKSIVEKSNTKLKTYLIINDDPVNKLKVMHSLFESITPVFLVINEKNNILQVIPLNRIKNDDESELYESLILGIVSIVKAPLNDS